MRTIHDWFSEYEKSHRNPTNKLIHFIFVPLIFFSVIGMLASIPSGFLQRPFPETLAPYINFGTVIIVLGLLFYLRLSASIFAGMLLVCLLTLLGNSYLASLGIAPLWVICALIFVFSWIAQFIGHKVEGKKPSFLKDLVFLLIGPAWILSFVYKKLGIRY